MMFIRKDGRFYGSKVNVLTEMYNDKLKEKRLLPFNDKQHILQKHYTFLKDTNEKVICSQDLNSKINNEQKGYILFIQDLIRLNVMHVRAKSQFYVGFAKVKLTDSIIRYSGLLRKLKIIDSQLVSLKQKCKDFGLTWFWEFKIKNGYDYWFRAYWFHDEIFGDMSYNKLVIPNI